MSWRRPLHSIATATPSLWGTLHQSSQKVLGTWYLMSQPNSFDHQGLCLPSVTFPHNWEAVSKKHAKISSRILKQVPLNNVALLLRPNQTLVAVDAIFKKSTLFSEWILLGCQRCPPPSWAHWRNNSGIELLFVLVFTMVFKVIPFNDFPCLWSVQVLCRCLTHSPYLSWRFAL